MNTSCIILTWATTSSRQTISASTVTPLQASYLKTASSTDDNLLASSFSGTQFTTPGAGTFAINWCARMASSSAGGLGGYINEFWILNTTKNVQLSHTSGYGQIAGSLFWCGTMEKGETVQFIGYCTSANSFAATGADHTITLTWISRA